ncbi:translation elongation factor Ts [Lentilactobacillus farraginis]|uniref:Elongation factor Ts n=1 Tax=Lentilactobacillus farraginis DSM 18382 = JCM 14108 TaxID=1423743 RepID=X0Q994_9LACO|nr:translation elongation factor Ts [Lentilactobacillus farraginis]KRM10004.1 elongation factor Ts [Lentilactobacillus farraginis DSM 18382 = JCM 14108]GAF35150.1 translation elongation factor Ts [Lentilactobacillus farraginis DSM 18382 = JCM 14108]
MAKISASQVMKLRKKTGVGMMDAKKALVATEGDFDKAIEVLREKGVAKAEKKSDRVAANGLATVVVKGNTAAIIEVNSETDFVASSDPFKAAVARISEAIVSNKPADVDAAMALKTDKGTVKDDLIETTQVTGEKVSLRRFSIVEKNDDEVFGSYLHNGGLIASLVQLKGADETTAKDVAMHVAATNPEYLNQAEVPADRLAHEKEILTQEALNEGKPEKIVEKMVEGRLHKFLAEICLEDQEFVKDPDQTVAQYVASKNGSIVKFIRYEVGEGIEKKQESFEDEVRDQLGN